MSNPGTKRRWSRDDELALATELAERIDDLATIALRWNVPYGYLRRIVCGERRPRIAEAMRTIVAESLSRARRIAVASACDAVKVLVAMMRDSSIRPDTRRRAALDVINLAFNEPEKGGVEGGESDSEPEEVKLSDVVLAMANRPYERRLALGLVDPQANTENEHADSRLDNGTG